MDNIKKFAKGLVQVGNVEEPEVLFQMPDILQENYKYFLSICNGGFTKDGFYHFFGLKGPICHNLGDWNHSELWKKYYGLNENIICFAEDIFGDQYFFNLDQPKRKAIKMLSIDNGEQTLCAFDFDDFVNRVVLSVEVNAESRELHQSFFKKEKIKQHDYVSHISYKIPICLGGAVDINNLELMDPVQHLRISGQIASQVKELPPGTKIIDIYMDKEKAEIELITEKNKKGWFF